MSVKCDFLAPTGSDSIAQAEGLGKESARTIHKPQRGATIVSHAPLGPRQIVHGVARWCKYVGIMT